MTVETIAPQDLSRSRLGERDGPAFAISSQFQNIPLANMISEDGRARAYRVTMGRLERFDGHVPNHINDGFLSQQELPNQLYSFAAGLQNTPANPPRRSEPVLFAPAQINKPVFVAISWGVSVTAPNRMMANWPAQGGSVIVHGSFLEVFGMVAQDAPALVDGSIPRMQAFIAPAAESGVADNDELSLCHQGVQPIALVTGAVFYVPDFARRAKVAVTLAAVDGQEIPFTGDPTVQLIWYDDQGFPTDWQIQGDDLGASTCLSPPQWNPVPARAVMLAVKKDPADARALQASVHWRIAP